MSAATPVTAAYLESLLAGQTQLAASPLAWLNALRAAALERVGVLTVPTLRDEDWRFTDISLLTKMSFHPLRTALNVQAADALQIPCLSSRSDSRLMRVLTMASLLR